MAYDLPDFYKDLALQGIADDTTRIVITDGAPASFAAANTVSAAGGDGGKLAELDITPPGQFTLGDGDVDGREATLAAQTLVGLAGVPGTNTGNHYVGLSVGNSRITFVVQLQNAISNIATSQNIPVGAVGVAEIGDAVAE